MLSPKIEYIKQVINKTAELLRNKQVSVRLLKIDDDRLDKYFDVTIGWGEGKTSEFTVDDLTDPKEARRFPMLRDTNMVPSQKNTGLDNFNYVALCLAGWWYLYWQSYIKGK